MRIAVIIYGLPGSGKGTQANLAAQHLGLIHFDTGRYIESVVHDQQKQSDPLVKRERKLFDSGMLATPSWVFKIVKSKTTSIAKAGFGIVFSGSPRTIFEAKKFMPILKKNYGAKNIFIFYLKIKPSTSIKRNGNRVICASCGSTVLSTLLPKKMRLPICPFCGGKFIRRTVDKPEIIKIRLREYEKRTRPVFEYLKKHGYKITRINGEPSPRLVSELIVKKIRGNAS